MATRHKTKQKSPILDDGAKSYSVYWSVYTDLPGRVAFRKLYWNDLKDAIGRPSELTGIEREDQWPSGLPSNELRAHIWHHMRAARDIVAVSAMYEAAMRVAPSWRIMTTPKPETDFNQTIFSMIWDRTPDQAQAILPFASLTSIMMEVITGAGFRVRRGFTIDGKGERERPGVIASRLASSNKGPLSIAWEILVQTSTKRELMEIHWPLLEKLLGEGCELTNLEKRNGDTGPFRLAVKQTIAGLTIEEAVVATLRRAYGLKIEQTERTSATLRVRGRDGRGPTPGSPRAIIGFAAMWSAQY